MAEGISCKQTARQEFGVREKLGKMERNLRLTLSRGLRHEKIRRAALVIYTSSSRSSAAAQWPRGNKPSWGLPREPLGPGAMGEMPLPGEEPWGNSGIVHSPAGCASL